MLASDVLYEARNGEQLLELLPRLTAAGGEIWLADPGRMTTADFIDPAAATWRIDAIPHDGPSHVSSTGSGSSSALSFLQRAVGLALGRALDEHAARHPAEDPARLVVLVLVVEARPGAAVQRREPLLDPRVRSRPGRVPSQTAWRGSSIRASYPLHLEVRVVQAERLVDAEALARLAAVDVAELAVDRHPVVVVAWGP